jgi:RNA-binding protein
VLYVTASPACAKSREWKINENKEANQMLTGKQKRFLRGLGHDLKPVITIGKSEITEAVCKEAKTALDFHELIKVKILESCLTDRYDIAESLARECSAEVAQVLGRTVLLYKKSKEAKIDLPKGGS